jgi:ATP adenylyltransferase
VRKALLPELLVVDWPEDGDDQAALIVHRGRHCFVILNNSPYNPGHLMVLPNREVGELAALTAEERAELMDLLVRCQAVLTKVMQPSGFNMGLNLGMPLPEGFVPPTAG